MIIVRSFREPVPSGFLSVNTTSRSTTAWSRGLSPFFLGPVTINGLTAQNVENAWQYSKVYRSHVDSNGDPTPAYFSWRNRGYAKHWASRYPMGKGGPAPLYSLVDGNRLSYIEARRAIYMPLYQEAVIGTEAFKTALTLAKTLNVALLDFDAYDHTGLTQDQVIDNPNKKMGHAFCLMWLLEKEMAAGR